MKTKHSLDNLKIEFNQNRNSFDLGTTIPFVRVFCDGSGDKSKAEAEANAKLIAAASELLEALQELVSYIPQTAMLRNPIEKSKKAILKATT